MNVGRAITDTMQAQRDKDLVRLVLDEMESSGRRMLAKLEAKFGPDDQITQYHRESMRRVGIDP